MTEKNTKKINWTADERDMLVSMCEDNSIATGKFSSSLTAADKAMFWQRVAESVNSVSTCKRSVDQVKKKWVDLKSQTKKKTISHLHELRKTGGGSPPVLDLEEWESKVLQTIPTCSVEGLKMGTDTFLANDAELPGSSGDLPAGGITSIDFISEETVTKARSISASTSEEEPKRRRARSENSRVEDLVSEQTAVMRELITAVNTLSKSVDSLNSSLKKYNDAVLF